MKLTTRNLLIILVVLGAIYGITQVTKTSGRSKALKTELVAIDTANVSTIEITYLDENLTLTKEIDGWKVSLQDGTQKAAKEGTVVSLLSSLNSIKPGRLAAKSQDRWKDYAVDSTGTRLKVYEEGKVSTDIVIGRFGMENQQSFYTFVRLSNEDEVYVANDFMGMSIGKDAASYRNNELLRLQTDSLISIAFNYPDSAFSLKKGEAWYLEDQPADSASVAGYLSGLRFVTSRNFYDGQISDNPSYHILFEFTNRPEVQLSVFLFEEKVVFNSSENPEEYFEDDALAAKLLKSKTAFFATSN